MTIYFTPYPTQNVHGGESSNWPRGTNATSKAITIEIKRRDETHRQENTIKVTCEETVEDGTYTVRLSSGENNYLRTLPGSGRKSFVFRPLAPGTYTLNVEGDGRFFASNSFAAQVPAVMVAPDRARVKLSQVRKSFKDTSTGQSRFRVTPTITHAWGLAQREIFVMSTAKSPAYDEFVRVATLVDFGSLPRLRPTEEGVEYLASEFTKIYDDVDTASTVGPILHERVDALFNAYNNSLFNFDTTPVDVNLLPGTVSYITDFERAVIALNNALNALTDAGDEFYTDDNIADFETMVDAVVDLQNRLSDPGEDAWQEVLDQLASLFDSFTNRVKVLSDVYGDLSSTMLETLEAEAVVAEFERLSGVLRESDSTVPSSTKQRDIVQALQRALNIHLTPHNKSVQTATNTIDQSGEIIRKTIGKLRQDQMVTETLADNNTDADGNPTGPVYKAQAAAAAQDSQRQSLLETLTGLHEALLAKKRALSDGKSPHEKVVDETQEDLNRADKAVRELCPNFEYS